MRSLRDIGAQDVAKIALGVMLLCVALSGSMPPLPSLAVAALAVLPIANGVTGSCPVFLVFEARALGAHAQRAAARLRRAAQRLRA